MLILGRADVEALLERRLCLEAVERALVDLHEGRAIQPIRTVQPLHDGHDSALFMPAVVERPPLLGTKVVTIYPGNHVRGVASHHGALLVFEAECGRPIALIEGSSLTAIRTAAVTALATRLLARPASRTLALLGTGVQARSHLEALLEVRSFSAVRVWSPQEPSRREFLAFARRLRPGLAIEATETVEAAVRGADVVTTVTAARKPILKAGWLTPGCHVNAVGASTATTREIDTATVAAAALFVDHLPAAMAEAGELLIPIAEGLLDPSHVRGELGAVAAGRLPGRSGEEEITLFKSVGLAVQDLAAAAVLLEAAGRRGAGQLADWT